MPPGAGAIEHEVTPPEGFVRLMVGLTAFVDETTMALAEDGEGLGSRQLDMGNSGSDRRVRRIPMSNGKIFGWENIETEYPNDRKIGVKVVDGENMQLIWAEF